MASENTHNIAKQANVPQKRSPENHGHASEPSLESLKIQGTFDFYHRGHHFGKSLKDSGKSAEAQIRFWLESSCADSLFLFDVPKEDQCSYLLSAVDFFHAHGHRALYVDIHCPSWLHDLQLELEAHPPKEGQKCLAAFDGLSFLSGDASLQEKFFHGYNFLRSQGFLLFFANECPPSKLDLTLPDLKTRLLHAMPVRLEISSDEDLKAAIDQYFDAHAWDVADDVALYLLNHYSRNWADVFLLLQEVGKHKQSGRLSTQWLGRFLSQKGEGSPKA